MQPHLFKLHHRRVLLGALSFFFDRSFHAVLCALRATAVRICEKLVGRERTRRTQKFSSRKAATSQRNTHEITRPPWRLDVFCVSQSAFVTPDGRRRPVLRCALGVLSWLYLPVQNCPPATTRNSARKKRKIFLSLPFLRRFETLAYLVAIQCVQFLPVWEVDGGKRRDDLRLKNILCPLGKVVNFLVPKKAGSAKEQTNAGDDIEGLGNLSKKRMTNNEFRLSSP
jgi:hypothetical protein